MSGREETGDNRERDGAERPADSGNGDGRSRRRHILGLDGEPVRAGASDAPENLDRCLYAPGMDPAGGTADPKKPRS